MATPPGQPPYARPPPLNIDTQSFPPQKRPYQSPSTPQYGSPYGTPPPLQQQQQQLHSQLHHAVPQQQMHQQPLQQYNGGNHYHSAYAAPPAHNSYSQHPQVGSMGPPPVRMEPEAAKERLEKRSKGTDMDATFDMLAVTGVDLKKEEEMISSAYRGTDMSYNSDFTQQYWTSDGQHNSRQLSQNETNALRWQNAARQKAQVQASPVNDPLLHPGNVYQRIERAATAHKVLAAQPLKPEPHPGVRQRYDPYRDNQVTDMISLLSLAAGERLRSVFDDALAAARARQRDLQGVVPPEWADIATGDGNPQSAKATSQPLTQTAWDDRPRKRDATEAFDESEHQNTRATTPPPQPQSTIAYKPEVVPMLQKVAREDLEFEQRRIARRKKREAARLAEDPLSALGTPGSTPAATPAPEPKMTKKERERQAKGGHQTEQILHAQANLAATMALGPAKKTYSWLSGGRSGGGGGSGSFSAGRGMATKGKEKKEEQVERGLESREAWKTLGSWTESGPRGRGIQLRDVARALEERRLERRTMARLCQRFQTLGDKDR
ncbi:hypothetical protein EJ06DRAFT_554738 [Trichodelitschia bisporula]|uniref:Transcription initiation factor TFIID subunit 4 n=1 Tax=Trichodelitschia bisporula TaxID=703511 RepID=A0A6G1I528_9PEZI|nr:hypothetical protein EJ06DRAFT_554738 [Trichodelitschia bisporula]